MPMRTTLFAAVAITTLYLLGFLFVLTGDPVHQFTDVLDLLRSVAMTAWIVWAVFFAASLVLKKVREQHLAEFAAEIGVDELGARRERHHGFSAAR